MKGKKCIPGAVLSALGLEMYRETPELEFLNCDGGDMDGWKVGEIFYDKLGNVVNFPASETCTQALTTSVPHAVRDIATGVHPLYDLAVKIPTDYLQFGQAAHEMYMSQLVNEAAPYFITAGGLLLAVTAGYEMVKQNLDKRNSKEK